METRTRLFLAEDGEARPVHDDEVDMEALRDSQLRHALHNEEWALCATFQEFSFRVEVCFLPGVTFNAVLCMHSSRLSNSCQMATFV